MIHSAAERCPAPLAGRSVGGKGRVAAHKLLAGSLLLLVLVQLVGLQSVHCWDLFGKKKEPEIKSIEDELGASTAPEEPKSRGSSSAAKAEDKLIDELAQLDSKAQLTTARRRPNLAKLQARAPADAGRRPATTASAPSSAAKASRRAEHEDDTSSSGLEFDYNQDDDYSSDEAPGDGRGRSERPAWGPARFVNEKKGGAKPNSRRDARRRRLQQEQEADSQAEADERRDDDEDDDGPYHARINQVKPSGLAAKFKKRKDQEEAQRTYVPTNADADSAIDKFNLKPALTQRHLRSSKSDAPKQSLTSSAKKSLFSSKKYLKKKMNQVYEKGLKPAAAMIAELPSYVREASDSLSALLQLDSRGRLLALIQEVEADIKFVKREFSKFTIAWSPIMEKGLNYLGAKDLAKIKWKANDELDFRRDALHSLVFGYEFARLMVAWRENLLVAHEAYKLYLETIKRDLLEQSSSGAKSSPGAQELAAPKVTVNEDFIFQVKTIHAYMLLTAWMTIDELNLEPRMKLDHLMEVEDDQPKNYESEYFRNIVALQELYEPTVEELDREERQVVDTVGRAGALTEDFEDVDKFFDDFRNGLSRNEVKGVDWQVPQELTDKLRELQPELQYNQLVYSKSFLLELKEARQRAQEESQA